MGKRVDLSAAEVLKGDPALHIVGKEEKSARKHAPLPNNPQKAVVAKEPQIKRMINARLDELKPLVEEYNELVRVDKILKKY